MIDLMTNQGGSQVKDFLAALTTGLQTNGALMKTFETLQLKRAKWNGRKMVLQAALNDIFGIVSPPYILVQTNQSLGQNRYFYRESELAPVYFSRAVENDPVIFYRASESVPVDYDFLVLIPTGIDTAELERQVKAQTNLIKLAGPKYLISVY